MSFRSSKSKSKPTENNSAELTLKALSKTQTNDHHTSDIEKLQNETEYNDKTLNLFINHVFITLDANIDDLKLLIDKKRPEQKIYKVSICDIWLRLKTIEQMETYPLVTLLRRNQLHRPEIKLSEINYDMKEIESQYLTNRRRSRFIHFHICAGSDEFNFNIGSYVGLVIFSYDNQSKFILNGHHCQRGDIIIKQMKFFGYQQTIHRGIYDALFKWYFGRVIDESFIGIGFLCLNEKWRFDLITCNKKEIFLYEYRILDMFMLTHWLTQFIIEHNVHEMEMNTKDILLNQYDIVKKKLINQESTELLNTWNEFIGSDAKDLELAIKQFIQTIKSDLEIIFKELDIKTTIHSDLLIQNNS
ncbi:unnamed protein product [Rotaria sp. Silwood2]|nr:unnamed protein product [Rotaria sp. Silwood2]CAF2753520.1 unnamed protein product [Rotaria sp. Silwood2]CAF3197062.1 unnamed protein product [Rotaria sp. Silwood2]CAF3935135.1 unnamed protein product [Rotaria sp. Silwood2]CAF4163677.1 unnamed protein product [Rotaria sp. Silwood2]